LGTCLSQNCNINNPLIIDAQYLNDAEYISNKIKEIRPDFKDNNITELKLQVNKCNIEIDKQIVLLKSQLQSISLDKQELLKVKDIQKIKEQITEKEKSCDNINKQIASDMQNVSFKGLFFAILKNIDPYNDSKEKLSIKADHLISPIAIKDLNGIFISSLTKVENAVTISEYIKSEVSGEVRNDKQLINTINPKYKIYIYLTKVVVSSLKKPVKTSDNYTGAKIDENLIINALADKGYKEKLTNFGINTDVIDMLEAEIEAAHESINSENDLASRSEKDIIANGKENLQQIKKEIEDLKTQLEKRSQILKNTIESKTTLKYDNNNSEASVNAAIKFLDDKMADLKNNMLIQKENELFSRFDVPVPFEGVSSLDIAKKTIEICKQLNTTYSKVEKFMETVEVQNAVVTNYQDGSAKDLFRAIDKIWLFPVAGQKDNYALTVIAKFKIIDEQQNTYTSHTTETKTDNLTYTPDSKIKTDTKTSVTTETKSNIKIDTRDVEVENDTKTPVTNNTPKTNSITDSRDGKTYNTVKIGTQTWMAENLNYETNTGSWCYSNIDNNCNKYGRFYNLEAAKKACPSGWRLPNDKDLNNLINIAGVDGAKKLKSISGWNNNGNGTDAFGFSALPGGFSNNLGGGTSLGISAFWWYTTDDNSIKATYRMDYNKNDIIKSRGNNNLGISVRCIKDTKNMTKKSNIL